MGKRERETGKRGEREAADILRDMFPEHAERIRRGWQSRYGGSDEPDVTGLPFHVEVAVGKAPNIRAKVAQATRDVEKAKSGLPRVIMTKRNREGWLVTVPLADLRRLMEVYRG